MPAKPYVYQSVTNGATSDGLHVQELFPSTVSSRDLEQLVALREKEAFQKGVEEGKGQLRAEFAQQLNAERERIAKAALDFQSQRKDYFKRVEVEVVKLALAISKKIIHREAQIDPLLLEGVARVALEKISVGTGMKLRVHPAQAATWREYFHFHTELKTPEVVPDGSLEFSHFILETSFGQIDLSLDAQLDEIERGFFDLLGRKPE